MDKINFYVSLLQPISDLLSIIASLIYIIDFIEKNSYEYKIKVFYIV